MKTNDSLWEIKDTLEKIRVTEHPEISPDIINEIIKIQAQNQDSSRRATGRVRTSQEIKDYIEQEIKNEMEG